MQTVTDNLKEAGSSLIDGIRMLLGENAPLRDINQSSNGLVFIGASYSFNELSIEQKRLQAKLVDEYHHFVTIIRTLLRTQSDEAEQKIKQNDKTIREIIEQTLMVWYETTEEAFNAAKESVEEMLELVLCLYDPSEGTVKLVPDTNALIYSSAFQGWEFDEFPKFEIILVPTVLSELDSLKTKHKVEEVRRKSQDVIRQIKEYRRRGRLTEGITIVKDRIQFRTIAFEPKFEESLPWLDPTSPDDRFLSSFLEVMRIHPRSIVVLVTGDINLQNKAEFARVPFIEPPVNQH